MEYSQGFHLTFLEAFPTRKGCGKAFFAFQRHPAHAGLGRLLRRRAAGLKPGLLPLLSLAKKSCHEFVFWTI